MTCVIDHRFVCIFYNSGGPVFKRYTTLSITVLTVLLFLAQAHNSFAVTATPYFYAVSHSEDTRQLIEINPLDTSIVSVVDLYHANGSVPDIQTFSLSFNPSGALFGWDTSAGQLYKINYTSATTARIDYIGSPTGVKVTGLAFDNTGELYGLKPTADIYEWELVSINPDTSGVTVINSLSEQIRSNGLAVDFSTGDLYGVSGNDIDKVFTVNKSTGGITYIGQLGTAAHGVGTEFLPGTRDLYSVRNMNELWKFDVDTKASSYIGIIDGTGSLIDTVSLAAKWPSSPPVVPEPVSSVLFISGGAILAGRLFIKK